MPSTQTSRLEGLTASVAYKAPVRVATTTAITRSGLIAVDSVTVAAGDRVLDKDATTASDRGIYIAATGAWERAQDFNGSLDIVEGTQIRVTQGGTNAGKIFEITTDNPIIIGTSSLTFAEVSLGGGGGGTSEGVATIAAMQALTGMAAGSVALLTQSGREGTFVWNASNLATKVSADTYQGIYVAPSSDTTGASGAWVRIHTGVIELAWFGVANGASTNAARVESAIELIATSGLGGHFRLPRASIAVPINFDRDVFIRRGIILEGHGATASTPGTFCTFPTSYSGFRGSWDDLGGMNVDPYDIHFRGIEVYQATNNTNTAIVSYNATTRVVTLPAAGDWTNGQLVWIEGAGITYAVKGRTGATTNGSPTITVTSVGGNPGVHVGQPIDVAGAGFPAGTTVSAWNTSTITASANATATVSGAIYTVIYPCIGHIVSGGGTTSLTLDIVSNTQNASNVVMRHADCGFESERPFQMENCISNNFPIGVYAGGDASNIPPNGTNTSLIRGCRFSSNNGASLVFNGWDANASVVIGCDFQFSDWYGVLELSLIGNHYHGCHFAFNVGIASPLTSNTSTMVQCYFETGTSYLGNDNGNNAYGCQGLVNGAGWSAIEPFGAGFKTPSILIVGNTASAITSPGGYFSHALRQYGGAHARFEGSISASPLDSSGLGVDIGQDATNAYVSAINRSTGTVYIPLRIRGSAIEIKPHDTLAVTFNSSATLGINVASTGRYYLGGLQLLSTRGAAIADATTDVLNIQAQLNTLLADIRRHGVIST